MKHVIISDLSVKRLKENPINRYHEIETKSYHYFTKKFSLSSKVNSAGSMYVLSLQVIFFP